jgi:hypothetical protein
MWRFNGQAGDKIKDQDGFASVDAMTGLAILASTLVLALSAHAMSRRMADAAVETRRATVLLQWLIDDRGAAAESGRVAGFDWRVETQPARLGPSDARAPLCSRSASVQSSASGRSYGLATLVPCPLSALQGAPGQAPSSPSGAR